MAQAEAERWTISTNLTHIFFLFDSPKKKKNFLRILEWRSM